MPGADGSHGTSALIYTALWVCGLYYSAQLLQVPNTCHAAPWRHRKGGKVADTSKTICTQATGSNEQESCRAEWRIGGNCVVTIGNRR